MGTNASMALRSISRWPIADRGLRPRHARMNEADSAAGSPFWRFSLGFYRRAGVADACIALQEQVGVDVNLLLFLLWQATMCRALSAAEVAALEKRVASWRAMTVIPLRTVRRALKLPPELVAPAM